MNLSYVVPSRNSETNQIEFTVDAEAAEKGRQNLIESQWSMFRGERTQRLSACDWVLITDVPLAKQKIDEWKTYRQALRDLPSTTEAPNNPVWPTPPQ